MIVSGHVCAPGWSSSVAVSSSLRFRSDSLTAARKPSGEGETKLRCGGARIPTVDEVAQFVRRCRNDGLRFKATAGLHHALPTGGEHGFLNLLAASVFGAEEEMLVTRDVELDAESFRVNGRAADAEACARVRRELFASIGSCSFDEPVGELKALGIL